MSDENLLGRHFPGESWRPWQGFLAVLTGQVATLPPDCKSLAAACTGRDDLSASPPFDEAWAIAGRGLRRKPGGRGDRSRNGLLHRLAHGVGTR